ncbi:MAG: nucleotidyltransferase domain-containing protein, partial [Deltaproteobacteria bacterium]|nr:nucleotidyltransferase domain-containing protein [Deltaproteobacteria bacterium]
SAEVILFGSRSRHDEHEFSDWDVLVVIGENLTDKNKIEIHNKIFEIELETGEIINSIIHTRKEWNNPLMQATPFYHNVLQEGVPL